MKITVASSLNTKKFDCLAISAQESQKVTSSAKLLNKTALDEINKVAKLGDITGKENEATLVHTPSSKLASRAIVFGLGKSNKISAKAFRKLANGLVKKIQAAKLSSAIIDLRDIKLTDGSVQDLLRFFAIEANKVTYQFNHYRKKSTDKTIQAITVLVKDSDKKLATAGAKQGQAIGGGISLCKDLANTPANVCNPAYLASSAKKIASKFQSSKKKVKASVLNEAQMQKLGMHSLLSVGNGSKNPSKLIVLEYRGAKSAKERPITFVGKGITFDTGGNSLKPAAAMIGMKYDMCGGATVLGVMQAAAELQLPLNIVGIVAAAENMPGADATRPDDIVKSMSGQTIEILNTDAEGRLVLCDAITYSRKFNPAVVIDIATLTGAIMIALGLHRSGIFSNCDPLAHELQRMGDECGDTAWHMPMGDEYDKTLDSKVADMQNIGKDNYAGSITAGCFLGRFAKDLNWAHLDVAGTASVSRTATGRPVSLLMHYLLHYAENKMEYTH